LREQYLRTNAYLARLVHLPGAPDYELYALLALRWALEGDLNAQGLSLNAGGHYVDSLWGRAHLEERA